MVPNHRISLVHKNGQLARKIIKEVSLNNQGRRWQAGQRGSIKRSFDFCADETFVIRRLRYGFKEEIR